MSKEFEALVIRELVNVCFSTVDLCKELGMQYLDDHPQEIMEANFTGFYEALDKAKLIMTAKIGIGG